MSIVYIKTSEDLYHCYKYKPIILNGVIDVDYIDNLNRCSPTFNDEGQLLYSCYLIRKYKGKSIISYKSNNIIFIVDDKLGKSKLGFTDFSSLINNKLSLFDLASYKVFIDLCKKWANPSKWLSELEYLEGLEETITVKTLNYLYINNRVDVWDYVNNIGKGGANYKTILSLDSNTLWYLFITKDVISGVRKIDPQIISYFELLKLRVLDSNLSVKFALIYLEIYGQTRIQWLIH